MVYLPFAKVHLQNASYNKLENNSSKVQLVILKTSAGGIEIEFWTKMGLKSSLKENDKSHFREISFQIIGISIRKKLIVLFRRILECS